MAKSCSSSESEPKRKADRVSGKRRVLSRVRVRVMRDALSMSNAKFMNSRLQKFGLPVNLPVQGCLRGWHGHAKELRKEEPTIELIPSAEG